MGVYSAEELRDMEGGQEQRIPVAPPPAIKVGAVALPAIPVIAAATPVESSPAKRGRPKKEPSVDPPAGVLPPQNGEQERIMFYESIRFQAATLGWRQHEFDEALFAATRKTNVVECSNEELRQFNEILKADIAKRASSAADPKAAINAEFAVAAEIESGSKSESPNDVLNEIQKLMGVLNMSFDSFTAGLKKNYNKDNVALLTEAELRDCRERLRKRLNELDAKDTPLLAK